jgi:uridine kinase
VTRAGIPTKSFVIGIAGGTSAGKTTVARTVSSRLHDAPVIDLDSYYLDRRTLPVEERERLNYDHPTAFDLRLIVSHLRRLAAGHAVEKPEYCFRTHTRGGRRLIAPAPFIVVEGLFALWWRQLRSLLDLKIFVDAPADVRLARRIRRDVADRGRTLDSVLAQYLETVRPMHDRYLEPCRRHADVVVSNEGSSPSLEDLFRALPQVVDPWPRRRLLASQSRRRNST